MLLAVALFSLGLSIPQVILQQDQIDSTLTQPGNDGLTNNSKTGKNIPGYDVPKPDGEPVPPPPPNDDEEGLGDPGP